MSPANSFFLFLNDLSLVTRTSLNHPKGRPDSADLAVARELGLAIRKKGLNGSEVTFDELDSQSEKIPLLYRLFGEGIVKRFAGSISVDANKCTRCQACVEACPVGCIDRETFLKMDSQKKNCIACMACIKICPEGARSQAVRFKRLLTSYVSPERVRREPIFYL